MDKVRAFVGKILEGNVEKAARFIRVIEMATKELQKEMVFAGQLTSVNELR